MQTQRSNPEHPRRAMTERVRRRRPGLGLLLIGAVAALGLAGCAGTAGSTGAAAAARSSLGGPLRLADEGSFFLGGKPLTIAAPYYGSTGMSGPGSIIVDQMYVQYRIPEVVTGPPVILVHGSNHSGATFDTTPDGREGWATYFARKGFPVYVVDHVGRGRSGFNPTPLNEAVASKQTGALKGAPLYGREGAWVNFRIGPQYPQPFPNSQFPAEAFDKYFAQAVPNAEVIAGGADGVATVADLALLLDRIGPAVVLVHSQAGPYGLGAVKLRPQGVKALVSIEGGCTPVESGDVKAVYARVPTLSIWGDNSVDARGINGNERRTGCRDLMAAISANGGRGTFFLLPDHGIKGNSHMMMLDRNNLQVADVVIDWVRNLGKTSN
jgi:pimeloyl-ACP methyl ester carboxylesterase